MAHFVITGAAGFIGSHTIDRFLAAGHTVTGVDNFRTGHRANLAAAFRDDRFTLVEADITNPGAIDQVVAARPTDGIVHLAALVSVPESIADPVLNYRLNVHATQVVAEAARVHRVPRLVFASSAAVYGESTDLPLIESAEKIPMSPYGTAKFASEILLLGYAAAFGLVVRAQRYFNVYGPRQDPASPYSGVLSVFARRFRAGQAVTIHGDGRQTRDFVSVHDVARANLLAATAPVATGVANICTGRPTSLLEIVEHFARHFPQVAPPQFAPARPGDIRHSQGAPHAAAAALGFRATVAIGDGLAELISPAAAPA